MGNNHLPNQKTEFTDDPAIAGSILQNGGIVIFPTETVYGIGASSLLEDSCRKIYTIKKRPSDNPLIVHVSSVGEVFDYGIVLEKYKRLIENLSPGPVSYILKKKRNIYSSGLDTIAIRVPSHLQASQILSHSGPVSAPSANISGRPSTTRREDVIQEFNGKVDCIFLGHDPEIGMESTVLDLSSEIPTILRPGFITEDEIEVFTPLKRDISKEMAERSPGSRYKHYSPNAPIQILDANFTGELEEDSCFIGFSDRNSKNKVIISNNIEYMNNLYYFFNLCDRLGVEKIYCESPLDDKFSLTLWDRLRRASGQI